MTERERFTNLAGLLDRAMADPALAATPHVAAVLELLAQGLLVLARLVIEEREAVGG